MKIMDRGDYLFAGGVVVAVSLLFLAVSTYEIPFYSPEANIQIVSLLTTVIGLVLVGYGFAFKRNRILKKQSPELRS